MCCPSSPSQPESTDPDERLGNAMVSHPIKCPTFPMGMDHSASFSANIDFNLVFYTNSSQLHTLIKAKLTSSSNVPSNVLYRSTKADITSTKCCKSAAWDPSAGPFRTASKILGIRGIIFMNKALDWAEQRICENTLIVFGRTTGMINDINCASMTAFAISINRPYFSSSRSPSIKCIIQ